VLTVSDGVAAGTREDRSGDALDELLRGEGYEVERRVVPDERDEIAAAIQELVASARLVLTTGGTGLAPRDVTPEATRDVLEREDAARPPLAGHGRRSRLDARRQPAGIDRRLPRRVRGPPPCACARARAPR
jgi:molybdopterin-biosynthesis enzyme MoeA-like protein